MRKLSFSKTIFKPVEYWKYVAKTSCPMELYKPLELKVYISPVVLSLSTQSRYINNINISICHSGVFQKQIININDAEYTHKYCVWREQKVDNVHFLYPEYMFRYSLYTFHKRHVAAI